MAKKIPLLFLAGVTLLVFLLLLSSFIKDLTRLHRGGVFVNHGLFTSRSRPLTPVNADMIQGWMTFDYINKVFQLPADYLKTTFDIKETSYPRVTIAKIARAKSESLTFYLDAVKAAIRAFSASSTPH
jgi:hypothetical protein